MIKGEYFVEFIHYDEALRGQERLKYLFKRYTDDKNDILEIKSSKIKELTNMINVLNQLSLELDVFKKLVPKLSDSGVEESAPSKAPARESRRVIKKALKLKKKSVKASSDSLKSLRLGLAQIKDELENM